MQMTQLAPKLGRNDVKLIGRDRFLVFMFLFAVIIAVVLRFSSGRASERSDAGSSDPGPPPARRR